MLLLCATDGSIAGEAALRVGSDLADRLHAELAAIDADTRDPAPLLLDAARATGCELLVVGYTSRARVDGTALPGWQRRVVRDAPCPVMLARVRHVDCEGRPLEQLASAAATHEAALVVIGGRRLERGLLARRRVAPRMPAGTRLPIVVAS